MDQKSSECDDIVLLWPETQRTRKAISYKIEGSCWICTSHPVSGNGYPGIKVLGIESTVHKYVYIKLKGQIPKGLCIRHTCDNKLCVNPDHLIIGTHAENMKYAEERLLFSQGEDHYKARFTNADIHAIRSSNLTHRKLGELYGVIHTVIGKIKRRETWKQV